MINKTGDKLIRKFTKPYHCAYQEVHWDISKYGTNTEGTSIHLDALNDKTIKYHIFIFSEGNRHLRVSADKVRKYLNNTPNALTEKFDGKAVVVTPLSIFEDVPDNEEIDIDVNQFN